MDARKPAWANKVNKNFVPRGSPTGRGKLLLMLDVSRIKHTFALQVRKRKQFS